MPDFDLGSYSGDYESFGGQAANTAAPRSQYGTIAILRFYVIS